jgi:hypothetical protein
MATPNRIAGSATVIILVSPQPVRQYLTLAATDYFFVTALLTFR